MADIKVLGKVFNGVSKLHMQNASGEGTTEFSVGGGSNETLKKLIDRSITSIDMSGLGLTEIGRSAFERCSDLTNITIPSGITKIRDRAFFACNSLASIIIPDSVTEFYAQSLHDCTSLTHVRANGAITRMATGSFTSEGLAQFPMSLLSARFPYMITDSSNPITTLFGGSSAGNACKLLQLVDLGSASSITTNAFGNCQALTVLILRKSDSICTLGNVNSFSSTPFRGYNSQTGTIYVPSSLIDTYKAASNWKTIFDEGYLTFSALETSPYANPDFVLS